MNGLLEFWEVIGGHRLQDRVGGIDVAVSEAISMRRTRKGKDDRMASLHTLEQRPRTVEARLAKIEGGYGDTLDKLHRDVVGVQLGQARMLAHLGVPEVTVEDIDNALDAE
ncbi:MAG: hypothetical protein ACRDTG_27225 [Pseudonocardiaceae bacterium]